MLFKQKLEKLFNNWASILLYLLSLQEGHIWPGPLEDEVHLKQSQDTPAGLVGPTKSAYSQLTASQTPDI